LEKIPNIEMLKSTELMKNYILALGFLCPFLSFSQINGVVLDEKSNEPVVGAKVIGSDGNKAITDFDGKFLLNSTNFPVTLITSMLPYANDTTEVTAAGEITIKLSEPVQVIQTVVVSAGRRTQEVEEVPISMEIIRPSLIDNKGITDLEQAVDQAPGVFTMDGQVSIRGGSGFAYGAGSRVLLLWNGMPLLSGYAGDTQWNAIPMEQASQIEIMKGAASVLYGSGALNGVIALTEKEPGLKPETKFKIQYGIYDNPRRESLKWWSTSPMNQQIEAYRGQMYKKFGYTVSTTVFRNDGYREGETEFRGRISGTLYFKPQKFKRVKTGIGYNYQLQKTGNFLIWQSDTFAYTPSGGADTSFDASTLTYNFGHRLFIDPYIKIIDKHNNRHNIKTRMYWAFNDNITNPAQSNGATIYFSEYQFQRQYKSGITLTSGLSNIYNVVLSELFGDHKSNNTAAYVQYEHHIKKLDIVAGMRAEYFEMDGRSGDSDFMLNKKDSTTIPFYPVFRSGFHYELAKYTHLRASIGQGIRYPSVAERYTKTSVGALNIFENPDLKPEIGWAAELGLKQGVKMGDWKGMIDLSGFVNQYSNMMEFGFIIFNPLTNKAVNVANPSSEDIAFFTSPEWNQNYTKYIGFQAQNAEKARISGLELSFNSMGKIKNVEVVTLIGYTYMNPISLNNDPNYKASFSDTTEGLLKYRFRHLAKADAEFNYKKYSFGFSSRYSGFMKNIDVVFEEAIAGSTYILPGLKQYRIDNNRGNLVFDVRFGYKLKENYRLGFMANNVFNAEYSSRPGDIQAPRNFLVQLQMKI
jgi:outer membrane receptor protein involved in Fe transport